MMIQQMHELAAREGQEVGLYFEAVVQKIYEDILKAGDTAIDVGANQGRHLFPMAEAVGPKGRIIAFEPISDLYEKLREQVRVRRLRNIRLHEYAAAHEEGISTFSLFENMKAYSGLRRRHTPFTAEEGGLVQIEVKRCLIDSRMPWFRRVALIKLDIEGGEYHALLGAQRVMARDRPVVIFENGRSSASNLYGYTMEDFFALFERHGYELYVLDGGVFTRDLWHSAIGCWEFIAYPKEKAHLARRLSGYCHDVLGATARA